VNVLDLFSGIGGFSLGLERAGMRTVAFCEIDPYCQRVLRRHWPDVPVFGDVRNLAAEALVDAAGLTGNGRKLRAEYGGKRAFAQSRRQIDLICGGFPCQDISVAGKGAGITGERSGLWSEFARIVGEVRPRYVVVENVAALLGRGIERVLGNLAALGFDAEWHCIPACAVGAPHRRDRVWIVAYAGGEGRPAQNDHIAQCDGQGNRAANVADADDSDRHWRRGNVQMGWGLRAREIAADHDFGRTQWRVEPDVGRVAHGISARVDRLSTLGNAIVPQIAEIIGRAIMEFEHGQGNQKASSMA
jgi:DNA (cytosine-5)-methyltransferase 1